MFGVGLYPHQSDPVEREAWIRAQVAEARKQWGKGCRKHPCALKGASFKTRGLFALSEQFQFLLLSSFPQVLCFEL